MSIKDRLDGNSEAWRPDDPKKEHPNPLYGKVVEVTTGTGDYGEYPLLFCLDENGDEWRVHCFNSVLKSRIAELRPEVGDEIGLKYLGTEKSKAYDTPYKNYKVVLEKAAATKPDSPDWDAIAAQAAAEADQPF